MTTPGTRPSTAARAASSERRIQLALALPLAIGQMGQQLMGVVDTAVLGRYSDAALAGAGVGQSLWFGIGCIAMGIVMGTDALIPQALGAGDPVRARSLLWQGLHLALLASIPFMFLVQLSTLALPWMGLDRDITAEAGIFIVLRSPQIATFLLYTALRGYLQAHHITRPMIIATVIANLANLLLDWILVFGDAGLADLGLPTIGLPPLGTAGAALSTVACSLLMVAILAHAVRRVPAPAGFTAAHRRRDLPAIAAIARIGLPIGLQLGAEVGIFALTTVLAGGLGKVPAAAHQIALSLASFTFSMAIGIGAATSVRVGHAIGEGSTARARAAGFTGLRLGLIAMAGPALIFVLAPAAIARLFTDQPAVIAAAVPLIRIAAVFQLSDGAQAIAAGALRGAGDTKATFWANVVGHYVFGLGVSLTLTFGLALGAPGLWWGFTSGLTATAILLSLRFARLSSRPIARV